MAAFEPNRCYACRKLFCCMDCCTNHIRIKHPGRESECPLCRSELLIVRNFDNSHFACHIVINHLPLHCRSCGDVFETSADLKNLGTCTRRLLIRKSSIISEDHSLVPHTPSLGETPLPAVNPRERYSIDGDYNSNFESLTSPPEFTRHTSTPMHIGLSRQSSCIVFKTPKSPNFSLKTPKTPQVNKRTEEARDESKSGFSKTDTPHVHKKLSSRDSNLQELLEQSESIYLSFSPSTRPNISEKPSLKSILLSKSPMEQEAHSVGLEGSSADMDLTAPISPALLAQFSQHVKSPITELFKLPPGVRDSGKRVRFSDQFDIKREPDCLSPDKSCMTDTDEFFEARQSLSEFSIIKCDQLSSPPVGVPYIKAEDIKKEDIKVSPPQPKPTKLDLDQHEAIDDDAENKENIHSNIENVQTVEKKEKEGNKFVTTKVSETSRVVMMVLVEKTSDSGNMDLKPLIDSGLRTLETVTTGMNSDKGTPPSFGSEMTKRVAVCVDSYKRVSSTECCNKIADVGNVILEKRRPDKPEGNGSQSGGLFFAVANAVRTAFKNISEAVSTRPIPADHSCANSAAPAIPDIKVEPPSFLQSPPTPRPLKRVRDELIAFDASQTDSDDSCNDIRSPEQKRQRAWYRQIRGREPIARMKSGPLSTSQGISSETQSFQQEPLSVSDSALTSPSCAHQATQTDH